MARIADLDGFLSLFALYGDDLETLYAAEEDGRYVLLFQQVLALLVQPTPFALSLPEPFRKAAHSYRAGDPGAVAHLDNPANRHFMLSDLYDLIRLRDAGRRAGRAKDQPV